MAFSTREIAQEIVDSTVRYPRGDRRMSTAIHFSPFSDPDHPEAGQIGPRGAQRPRDMLEIIAGRRPT